MPNMTNSLSYNGKVYPYLRCIAAYISAAPTATRHYHWYNIQPRHFFSTAKHVGFNQKTAQSLFTEMLDSVDEVIRHVEAGIPVDFPDRIASPILNGMRKQRDSHLAVSTG